MTYWNVIRTKGCHEKIVYRGLESRGIKAYLPEVPRPGASGRALRVPLFSGFVFVKPEPAEVEDLNRIPGSCGLIRVGNRPGKIQEMEMDRIRTFVFSGSGLRVHPDLTSGRRMRVVSGQLAGLEGEFIRHVSEERLILNVELLGQAISMEINGLELEPCDPG